MALSVNASSISSLAIFLSRFSICLRSILNTEWSVTVYGLTKFCQNQDFWLVELLGLNWCCWRSDCFNLRLSLWCLLPKVASMFSLPKYLANSLLFSISNIIMRICLLVALCDRLPNVFPSTNYISLLQNKYMFNVSWKDNVAYFWATRFEKGIISMSWSIMEWLLTPLCLLGKRTSSRRQRKRARKPKGRWM